MKNKFTPGRWYAVGRWVEHEDDSVADICSCNPADFGQEHLKRSDDETLANARLIAAAPAMFEMLTRMTAQYACVIEFEKSAYLDQETFDEARQLIAQIN